MSVYFSYFPLIEYNNVSVRDVTRRTNLIESSLSNPYVFLPYSVKEGEKPEDIAYNYYGTVDATWLVLMANNITDPYTQWPMNSEVFSEYIISKYAEASGTTGYDVVSWTQNETIIDNIVYYYKDVNSGLQIKVAPNTFPYTYNQYTQEITGRDVVGGYYPMRIYDYELAINDAKREINVVEQQYYSQINNEFRKLIVK